MGRLTALVNVALCLGLLGTAMPALGAGDYIVVLKDGVSPVSVAGGTGKLKMAGGVAGAMKESVQRAFSYLQAKKVELGVGRDLDMSDLHVEVIDLLGNRVEGE